MLVSRDADVNAKDKAGRTALDLVAQKNNTEIVALLRKHGAKE
ncbi:MAG: ankyrin repeat domain-containing protein [Planctomycetes bacterium]|nr:ankyrin repeat domain-containing protein [Planctomycetota bacterium]